MYHVARIEKKGFESTLKFSNFNWYKHELNQLKDGQEVVVSISTKKDKRSDRQNRYYWAYITQLLRETDGIVTEQRKNALHGLFKDAFLGKKRVQAFGIEAIVDESTTQLSKDEFSAYIDKIAETTGMEPPPTESYDL